MTRSPHRLVGTEEAEVREADARLAVGAMAGWLAVLVGARTSPAWVVGTAVAAVLSGLAVLAGRHRVGRLGAVAAAVALVLFCVAAVLLPLAARMHGLRAEPVRGLSRARAAALVWVTVAGDPRPLSGGFVGHPRVALDATLTAVRTGNTVHRVHVPVVVLAPADSWSMLLPGQAVRLDGRLAPPESVGDGAAVVTARGEPTRIGGPPWWQQWAERVRRSLRAACAGLPAAERGLLPGLVVGDTSHLDPALARDFRTAGLTHLVAVSGTNVAIVVAAVLLVARRLPGPPWLAAVLAAITVVAFVVVARPSPSVLRAAVMASVLLVALATGRPRQGLPALAAAVLLLLGWHPEWAANTGFALSVLATAALLLVAPGWADALRRRHVPVGLAEALAVAAAAGVVSAPVIVMISGRVSLVALPANLLAEVAVAPATVLGVIAAAAAPASLGVGTAFAQLAGWPCRWLVAVATYFGTLAGATVSWPRGLAGALLLAAVLLVLIVLARYRPARLPLIVAAVTALAVQIPVRAWTDPWPSPAAVVVACDVGQGDGIVLPVGHHAAVVMDSGPEPQAIDRCLTSLGINSVPVYVQSHFDLDHVGGFPGVVHGRRIGRVFTGPLQQPALGRSILHSALAPLGIVPAVIPAGATLRVGPLRLDVLASHIVFVSGQPDSNNSSVVLRASTGGRTILLTGDAATEAQQFLVAGGVDLRADILKVPHHGSAYFDPDFMAAVHPAVALISVGAGNPYGHPTVRLLRAMRDLRVPVRRTDLDGDVAVLATPRGLRTVSHRPSARLVNTAAVGPPGGVGSAARATMGGWLPVTPGPAPPRPAPPGPGRPGPAPPGPGLTPLADRSMGWSWWSATRSSWSVGPSSRSPPITAAAIRAAPTSSSGRGPWSSPASCTNC